MRVGRWHDLVLVIGDEALPEFARVEVASGDDFQTVAVALGCTFYIEAQVGLAVARVRTVAVKATVREDGKDFAAEADLFRSFRGDAASQ